MSQPNQYIAVELFKKILLLLKQKVKKCWLEGYCIVIVAAIQQTQVIDA
jgi:hypothetical protein